MKKLSVLCGFFLLGGVLAGASPAFAEGEEHPQDAPAADAQVGAPVEGHKGHGAALEGAEHAAHEGAEHAAHGEGHDHAPTFDDVNWAYGFLGEKEDLDEPSLLWRPKGMPVPFGALALNAAILYLLLFKFGKKPIGDALKARKLGIMKGMEDAAKVKAEAEASLAKYQTKLDNIEQEIARIKQDMKEAGEAESARILSEAKERRARMERDARTLVDQELKAARESLLRDTVRAAVKSAEQTLTAKVGDADQQRLADEYLGQIKASGAALRGRL